MIYFLPCLTSTGRHFIFKANMFYILHNTQICSLPEATDSLLYPEWRKRMVCCFRESACWCLFNLWSNQISNLLQGKKKKVKRTFLLLGSSMLLYSNSKLQYGDSMDMWWNIVIIFCKRSAFKCCSFKKKEVMQQGHVEVTEDQTDGMWKPYNITCEVK